ncbi:MAG: GGDEF domain-containing protein, partial [Vibrio sp.]
MLAEVSFEFLATYLKPPAMVIVFAPSASSMPQVRFSDGETVDFEDYPPAFWEWAAQFGACDGLIPFTLNPCGCNDQPQAGEDSFLLVLDSHPQHRAYLIIAAVSVEQVHQLTQLGELDVLSLVAIQWQCVRTETEAFNALNQRDQLEARYISEIRQHEQFIDNLKLVHQLAVELANPTDLDDLHRTTVEAIRSRLGFDRA